MRKIHTLEAGEELAPRASVKLFAVEWFVGTAVAQPHTSTFR